MNEPPVIVQAHVPYLPETPIISAWAYLAWVAYPDSRDKDEAAERQGFVEACAAGVLKGQGKHVPQSLRHIKRERVIPKINKGIKMDILQTYRPRPALR